MKQWIKPQWNKNNLMYGDLQIGSVNCNHLDDPNSWYGWGREGQGQEGVSPTRELAQEKVESFFKANVDVDTGCEGTCHSTYEIFTKPLVRKACIEEQNLDGLDQNILQKYKEIQESKFKELTPTEIRQIQLEQNTSKYFEDEDIEASCNKPLLPDKEYEFRKPTFIELYQANEEFANDCRKQTREASEDALKLKHYFIGFCKDHEIPIDFSEGSYFYDRGCWVFNPEIYVYYNELFKPLIKMCGKLNKTIPWTATYTKLNDEVAKEIKNYLKGEQYD